MAIDPDELRAMFLEEFQEHHATLQHGLLELERDPDAGDRLLPELFRAAHTIKGSAQIVHLPEVARTCHDLEDVLSDLRDGTRKADPDVLAGLIDQVDELAAMVGADPTGASDGPATAASGAVPADPAEDPDPGPSPDPRPPPSPGPALSAARHGLLVPAGRLDRVLDQATSVVNVQDRLSAVERDSRDTVTAAQTMQRHWRDVHAHAGSIRDPRAAAAIAAAGRSWRQVHDQVDAVRAGVAAASRELGEAVGGLESSALRLRLQPFRLACEGMERAVRDLTHGTPRQAVLVVTGGDVELDSDVVAALRQPLLHLVRNAVAHGIEPVDRRREAGKDDTARIVVDAQASGSRVVVSVSDDGAGFDLAALRRTAGDHGHEAGTDDDNDAALRLAWVAGVSTAEAVDSLAGRGVGLDAVRFAVEQLGGTVELDSTPGLGSTVRLHLPVSLATLHAVIVTAGDQTVAIPSAPVRRIVGIAAADVVATVAGAHVVVDGEHARVVWLRTVLGLPPRRPSATETGVLLDGPQGTTVLVVDGLVAARQITRRQLASRLDGAPGVVGTTMLVDGTAALVLNPLTAMHRARPVVHWAAEDDGTTTSAARILIAEDSPAVRLVERRILEQAGYAVAVAHDGAAAWQQLLEVGADLLVSDVEMPNMGGIELCRTVRDDPRFQGLPVVLVTARGSDQDRQQGMEAGADAYLVKGQFEPAALVDTVRRLL